ncbi:MAG: hypothetical protein PHS86_05355 [Syntrophaceae bacterium]|nr:hypothetical protein [Syntrophaceae bacterium]
MKMRLLVSVLVVGLLVVAISAPTFAGGPICKPPMCAPPPMCGPQPMCGPPPCPPPSCEPGPLKKIFSGAFNIVTGVIGLPFKIVDKMIDCFDCGPASCGPKMTCGPAALVPPVVCAPIIKCAPPACAPPICGPPACGPMPTAPYGVGYRPPVKSMGYGHGAPMRMSPMSKNEKAANNLLAAPNDGVFGSVW